MFIDCKWQEKSESSSYGLDNKLWKQDVDVPETVLSVGGTGRPWMIATLSLIVAGSTRQQASGFAKATPGKQGKRVRAL